MRDTITITGSYGSLTVNRQSGAIISYEPRTDDEPAYSDIVRFDVNEARLHYGDDWGVIEFLDILRIGFWTNTGEYVPNERATVDAIHAELDQLTGGDT